MAEKGYAQLAALSLELFPEVGPDETLLRAERAYLSPQAHTRVGRLALVCVERARCAEDDTDFADGSTTHATARIEATTFWLVNGARFMLECKASYGYSIPGHSGGVDEVIGVSDEPRGSPGELECTLEEWHIMRNVGRLSVMSRFEKVVYFLEDYEPGIPAPFVVRVVRELGLSETSAHLGAPEVELSWAEWDNKEGERRAAAARKKEDAARAPASPRLEARRA